MTNEQKRDITEATRKRFIEDGFECTTLEDLKGVYTFDYSKKIGKIKVLGSIIIE